MYAKKVFRETRPEILLSVVRSVGAVSMVTLTGSELMSTLVPVLVDGTPEDPVLIGHIAKANPQWQKTDTSADALAICVGANGYVSPSFYPSKLTDPKVVPTWNFVQVQAHGRVEFIHDKAELLSIVESLTNKHEQDRPDPWSVADAPDEFIEAKLAGIVGLRMTVERLDGSFKLGQDRSEADRAGVVAGSDWMSGLNASTQSPGR